MSLLQLASAHAVFNGTGGTVTPPDDPGGGGGGGGGGSGIPARASDDFADFPGINTHWHYTNANPYMYQLAATGKTQKQTALDAMALLKFRHVRNDFAANTYMRDITAALHAQQGVKMLFVPVLHKDKKTGAITYPSVSALTSEITSHYDGLMDGVSGFNEPDLTGITDWASRTKTYQQALYPAFNRLGIPVMSPPLGVAGVTSRYATLGSMVGISDQNDMHIYPGGQEPTADVDNQMTAATKSTGTFPSKPPSAYPTIISETGYQTGLLYHGGNPPVPEDIEAIYAPKLFAELFWRGFKHAYWYQLFDGQRDTNTVSTNDATVRERHFGFEAWDGGTSPTFRPKPAMVAVGNLMTLVSDPGVTFSPAPLGGTLPTLPSDMKSLLLGRRDGTYLMLLWRKVSLWTPNASTTVSGQGTRVTPSVATETVTLTLDTAAQMRIYRPSVGAAAQSTVTSRTTHSIPVGFDLVVAKIG